MAVDYWDTSALLKLYVREPDSSALLELVAARDEPIYSSNIAEVEVAGALFRKEQVGDLTRGGAETLIDEFYADASAGRIVLVPYGTDVAKRARRLLRKTLGESPPVVIRSLDAIHLATALLAGAGTVVATDRRMRDGAVTFGLAIKP